MTEGYFVDDDEHRRVVQQVVAALSPRGDFEHASRRRGDVFVTRGIDGAHA